MKWVPSSDVRRRDGFTVIELLVSMVVAAVLVALAISGLNSARDTSRRAACVSNLRQLGGGIMLYAGEHEGQLPFGPQATAFGMGGNLYTSTGAPTSLITLQNGKLVGLGLILPYLKEPRCFFCPGNDQPLDTAKELENVGKKQVQSSYYYRHAGNTNVVDIRGAGFNAPRLAALGNNRRGKPLRALVMDSQFLCNEGLRGFGAVPRTHHRAQSTNVLYSDGHVLALANPNDVLNVDITGGGNAHQAFSLILEKFEIADDGVVDAKEAITPSGQLASNTTAGGGDATESTGKPVGDSTNPSGEPIDGGAVDAGEGTEPPLPKP